MIDKPFYEVKYDFKLAKAAAGAEGGLRPLRSSWPGFDGQGVEFFYAPPVSEGLHARLPDEGCGSETPTGATNVGIAADQAPSGAFLAGKPTWSDEASTSRVARCALPLEQRPILRQRGSCSIRLIQNDGSVALAISSKSVIISPKLTLL